MARTARCVVAGYPLHVTQRGNYRQPVFQDDEDRRLYLAWLNEYKARHGLRVWAWCLMDNHVHLVCVPSEDASLSSSLRHAHMRYAGYFNRKNGRQGHLWQGRFYSCLLDDKHLWAAVRYVERNPVRAGMVEVAWEYPWSSAQAHVNGAPDGVLDEGLPVKEMVEGAMGSWARWLEDADDEKLMRRLRTGTQTGRPVGSPAFIDRMESSLGRRLRPAPPGRPKKEPG